MTLTDEMTQRTYLEAQQELEAVLRSRDASRDQKQAALHAMEELDRDFLRKATASLAARTKQLKLFIERMNAVVDAVESHGSPVRSLIRLREIIDEAGDMIDEPEP